MDVYGDNPNNFFMIYLENGGMQDKRYLTYQEALQDSAKLGQSGRTWILRTIEQTAKGDNYPLFKGGAIK